MLLIIGIDSLRIITTMYCWVSFSNYFIGGLNTHINMDDTSYFVIVIWHDLWQYTTSQCNVLPQYYVYYVASQHRYITINVVRELGTYISNERGSRSAVRLMQTTGLSQLPCPHLKLGKSRLARFNGTGRNQCSEPFSHIKKHKGIEWHENNKHSLWYQFI